jgi:hypothetical protein
MRRNYVFASEWSFWWNFLFDHCRGYSHQSISCPFPSLLFLPHKSVRLFFYYLFFLFHRFVLAFSLKLHIRLFDFLSTVFFLGNRSQTHISFLFFLIWIRTQPYVFLPSSNPVNIFLLYTSFLFFFLSLNFFFELYISCPFHILIF